MDDAHIMYSFAGASAAEGTYVHKLDSSLQQSLWSSQILISLIVFSFDECQI